MRVHPVSRRHIGVAQASYVRWSAQLGRSPRSPALHRALSTRTRVRSPQIGLSDRRGARHPSADVWAFRESAADQESRMSFFMKNGIFREDEGFHVMVEGVERGFSEGK